MTAYNNGVTPPAGLVPADSKQWHKPKLDIPKIRLLSWLGLESVLWAIFIGHLVKWAIDFYYFVTFQVRYAVGYQKTLFTVWYLKDWWDRLPVHISNLFGQDWFGSQAAPQWWVTDRHLIRDVGIGLVATILVELLFTKPKYPADDRVSVHRYVWTVPMALGAAAIPITAIALLAWKIPWLMQHGWMVPSQFGALASEVNGWIEAGAWIAVLMGVLGGLAAKRPVQRVADDVQWFFAERSAGKVRSNEGLNKLRGNRVIGTPAHRKRVQWLLVHRPDLPKRNPWLVRGLLLGGFLGLAFSGAGAWLTLVGPAAVH